MLVVRVARLLVLASVALTWASCSRALRFNFAFGGDDLAGVGKNDLAAPQDLAMQLDLPSGHDLMATSSKDLAPIADLSSTVVSKDLRTMTPPDLLADLPIANNKDLLATDLPQSDMVTSLLGTACNPANYSACGGISSGLSCITSYSNVDTVVLIKEGYCTKACSTKTECDPYGGLCRPLGTSGTYCMPACTDSCVRGGYTCCNYCENTTTCTVDKVCAPPSAPGFCN